MTPPSSPETFQTERLLLRRPTPDDAVAMFEGWAHDVEAVRYLAWQPHTDLSQAAAHIARCETAWDDGTAYLHMIVARETGQLLGSLGSRLDEHGVNFGYVLSRAQWGHGYMAEALTPVASWWLTDGGVHRVWATCHTANVQSGRVLEKAGFQLEGTLRRWGMNPNVAAEPSDHLCYSRARSTVPGVGPIAAFPRRPLRR